jgi:hypothetical protein
MKTSSSFSITVKTGVKASSYEEIQDLPRLTGHIVDHIDSYVSQMIHAEAVNPAAYDLIHSFGSQLIQFLLEIKAFHWPSFLAYHFAIAQFDDPDLRADIKTRRNTIPKQWHGNFHGHEIVLARMVP